MQLDYLREFQYVASTLNYTKAAKALSISQSALSKHMIELENTTGLTLFDHAAGKTTLTSIGVEFLKEVSLMMSTYDAGLKKCLALQEQGFSSLTFQDASLSAGMRLMYRWVQKYSSNHPHVDISFDDMRTCGSVEEALQKDVVDISLDMICGTNRQETYRRTMEEAGYRAVPIFTDSLIAWIKKDNRLADCEYLSFDDIKGVPIMTSLGKVFDSVKIALQDMFAAENLVPLFRMVHIANLSDTSSYYLSDFRDAILFTTIGMVEDGRFSLREDITYRASQDPKMHYTLYLVAKDKNEPASNFLDYIIDQGLVEHASTTEKRRV